jgi:hypothetical protein
MKSTLHSSIIQLMVNFLFKPDMPQVRFFVRKGPSIAYALSGKEKETGNGLLICFLIYFPKR